MSFAQQKRPRVVHITANLDPADAQYLADVIENLEHEEEMRSRLLARRNQLFSASAPIRFGDYPTPSSSNVLMKRRG